MKKWNTPEIAALDLNATESGLFCTDFETWLLFNDNLKKCPQNPQNEDPTDPSTPTDPTDPATVDALS